VAHLVPDYERTLTIRLGRDVSPEAVAAAERLVNRIVAERTLDEARSILAETVRDNVTDEGIVVREVALRRDDVFSEPAAVELCFEEAGQILAQPELSDPRTLQLLLRILHDRGYLTALLADRQLDRVEVTIGSEHGDLRRCLVTAGYNGAAAECRSSPDAYASGPHWPGQFRGEAVSIQSEYGKTKKSSSRPA
jgi:transcriptional regulator of heat shock response